MKVAFFWGMILGIGLPIYSLTAFEQKLDQQSGRNSTLFKKGKKLYSTPGSCVTCHMTNGKGLEAAQFPPLVNTEWVTGSEEVLIRITLHGIQGPMKVGDKEYGLVPMVPTIWANWSDEEIAAVLTYIRNEWGNEASEISPETVKKIRAKDGKRRAPWTVKELEALKK